MNKTIKFKPQSSNIFFHLLTKCNLRCRHCYINPQLHGKKMLNIKTIENWLRLLAHFHLPSNLTFLGGEPTLHPDLAKAVSIAKRIGFKSISINTNGFLFNNILDKVSPTQIDNFAFSLDGANKKINDRIRGEGSFKTCLKNIQLSVKKGFNVSVCFTVSRLNISNLVMLPQLLADLGAKRLFIQFVGVRGRAKLISNVQPNGKEWQVALGCLKKEAQKHRIWITFPKIFLNSKEKFLCAGECSHNLNVFPNGKIFRCPLGIDLDINFANISNGRLAKSKKKVTEEHLFALKLPWGCPLSKIAHPDNLEFKKTKESKRRIGCCMLKEDFKPA